MVVRKRSLVDLQVMKLLLNAWKRCRVNLRANFVAGLIIWTIGATVYIGHENSDIFRNYLDEIADAKNEFGYIYSALSTGLFGGLIPFLALLAKGRIPFGRKYHWFLFFLLFWACKGVEVDAFYRLQSYLLGESPTFPVVFAKVLVDQFIYCVFWSAPITAIFYGWKDSGFCWSEVDVLKDLRQMIDESLFLLVSTWIIWIPAVSIIYSMPSNLQIPLFNLTLCFFVLVITITGEE